MNASAKKYLNARDFFQRLAEIQFESGYPYIMYEDTVNRANPIAGRINMSNLCSEILQVNSASEYDENLDYARTGHDISCNLGSLNIAHTMDSPDFARTVETAVRGLTAVSDMSHIRSVPSIEAGNAASHAIGLGQMNLHGYLAREGIAYGSPEALDFTNLYFYTITWHALRTSMLLARERGETFAGSNSHAMPVVNISANICKVTGSRKRRKLANCLPVAVLRYLPVRCGRSCATT